ncbi:MAG TPA: hormogonium polysaccharide biosynthesis protein HpsL [Coleofasciculaceae cyanobacterium]
MLKTRQLSNPQAQSAATPAPDNPDQSHPAQGQSKPRTSQAKTSKAKTSKAKPRRKSQAKSTQADSSPPVLSLKEQMAEKRKRDRFRKELTTFLATASFFGLIIGGLLGLMGGIKIAVAGLGGTVMLAIACKYPRLAMWGFLIYVPFGGTITYAIGNSPLLQLAKDGLYIPALIGVLQHCKRERLPFLIPKQIKPALTTVLVLCSITLLLVNGYQQFFGKGGEQPIAMGILGLKVMLGYLPLIPCAYYLLRSKQDFYFLMRLTIGLVIICCALAMVQYLMLLTGKCAGTRLATGNDLFKASLEARCFVGGALLYSPQEGVIRLPGTFVAPWQWGWFLISSSFLVFPSAFNDPKPLWRLLGLVGLGCIFVLAVISGQRIALALVPIVIGILLIVTGQVTNLKRFLPIAILLGLVLSIAALQNPATVQERIDSFVSRWNAAPPYAFILGQFEWAMKGNTILGHGLGRATNSARALGQTELVETYYPKMLYEIGPLGTIAFLVLVSVLTHTAFKAYRSVRDRTLRSYGSALAWFVLFISYNTYYYPLDVDPVSVYYWFFAGVALKLPELDRLQPEANAPPLTAPGKKPLSRNRLKRPGFA